MKDVTTTSFGLIIAYLLPGMMALATCSFWLQQIRDLFVTVATADTTVGLFFLFIFMALIGGILLNAFRWIIYERLFFTKGIPPTDYFAMLGDAGKLAGFNAAIDENFRYHQFYGAASLVFPFIFVGILQNTDLNNDCGFLFYLLIFITVELVLVFTAKESLQRYRDRLKAIFKK